MAALEILTITTFEGIDNVHLTRMSVESFQDEVDSFPAEKSPVHVK